MRLFTGDLVTIVIFCFDSQWHAAIMSYPLNDLLWLIIGMYIAFLWCIII